MIAEIYPKDIVIDSKMKALCKKTYYGHPHGCINYGKKKGCPPDKLLLDDLFDFTKPLFIIYTEYPIGKFAERMRQKHPEWASQPRNWYNPRRWQSASRKFHRKDITGFLESNKEFAVDTSPEARGLDVTDTMLNIGIRLDWKWPPEHLLENNRYVLNLIKTVSFAGIPLIRKDYLVYCE